MGQAFASIAFTPAVRAMQTRMGSRAHYAALEDAPQRGERLGAREREFIETRDHFFQATVGETGWPYVQHRGGPAGFLRVLDECTIGYADFRGNVQYVSVGNLHGDDRVALILMDYAEQRRLKVLGRARLVEATDDPALIERLRTPAYAAEIERAMLIDVEAWDWNCPQHITPRYTEAEIDIAMAPLRAELERLRRAGARALPQALGSGPLALVVSGVRQITSRVRAYELRRADGGPLPEVDAGAHIDMPLRLPDGRADTRRYSIASNPRRRDAYEIAVLLEEHGSGGSRAVHEDYALGLTLHCALPGNEFRLHEDMRPSVLIAAGIGITPIKPMAQTLHADGRRFALHYAVRSRREGAYLDRLEREFGARMAVYAGDEGQRLDLAAVVAAAPPDALFYVCGPARLIEAARAALDAAGIDAARLRIERFSAAPTPQRALTVTLQRSGRTLAVPAQQSVLDAVRAAGIAVPSACRAGTCGTCAVRVLAGAPEHRDSALSESQRRDERLMCLCVSRASGEALTLDL